MTIEKISPSFTAQPRFHKKVQKSYAVNTPIASNKKRTVKKIAFLTALSIAGATLAVYLKNGKNLTGKLKSILASIFGLSVATGAYSTVKGDNDIQQTTQTPVVEAEEIVVEEEPLLDDIDFQEDSVAIQDDNPLIIDDYDVFDDTTEDKQTVDLDELFRQKLEEKDAVDAFDLFIAESKKRNTQEKTDIPNFDFDFGDYFNNEGKAAPEVDEEPEDDYSNIFTDTPLAQENELFYSGNYTEFNDFIENGGIFDGGIALNKDNTGFSGKLIKDTPDNNKLILSFSNGVIQKATMTDLDGNTLSIKNYSYSDSGRLSKTSEYSYKEDRVRLLSDYRKVKNGFDLIRPNKTIQYRTTKIGYTMSGRSVVKEDTLATTGMRRMKITDGSWRQNIPSKQNRPTFKVIAIRDKETGENNIKRIFSNGSYDILKLDRKGVNGRIEHYNRKDELVSYIERKNTLQLPSKNKASYKDTFYDKNGNKLTTIRGKAITLCDIKHSDDKEAVIL